MKNTAKTIVYHKVADFAIWKEIFNVLSGLRFKAGALSSEVGTLHNDPSTVYIINEWKSMDAAKAFLSHSDLAINMQKAGITEKPYFLFLVKNNFF